MADNDDWDLLEQLADLYGTASEKFKEAFEKMRQKRDRKRFDPGNKGNGGSRKKSRDSFSRHEDPGDDDV